MTEAFAAKQVILERMLSLWLSPSDQRKEEFELNDRVDAAEVYNALALEFGAARAAEAVMQNFLDDAELAWQNPRLSRLECTRIECGLQLLQYVPAIEPTIEQVQQLVCKLPGIYASFRLKHVVRRHLELATLVDALTWGVQNAPAAMPRSHCLTGLYHYSTEVTASDPSVLETSLQGFERELRRWRDKDEDLLGEVKNARRWVQGIRRRHPELPVPAAHQFRASRIEEGGMVRYFVERREDHERSIEVSHLELRGRNLLVEYSVLDPAILTENAPGIIASTLLTEYAADTHRERAQQADCFDVDWQQTRSISL